MKKITKILLMTTIVAIAFGFGYFAKSQQIGQNKQSMKIVKTLTKQTNNLNDLHLNDDDVYVELTDGSWGIYNDNKHDYIFQPKMMGDWDYHFDNKTDFEHAMQTYISMNNNGYF